MSSEFLTSILKAFIYQVIYFLVYLLFIKLLFIVYILVNLIIVYKFWHDLSNDAAILRSARIRPTRPTIHTHHAHAQG